MPPSESHIAAVGGSAPQNLHEAFRRSVDRFAGRRALVADGGKGKSYTYAELGELVDRGARILSQTDESVIGLIGENKPEWPIAYLAITATGKTVVPIDCHLKPAEISAILSHSGVRTIIAADKNVATLLQIDSGLRLLYLDSSSPQYWLREKVAGEWKYDVSPDRVAVIIYTSGTTGDPKAVELTHRNLLANQAGVEAALAFNEDDVFLSVLPLHHTFEASCGFLTPLLNGCSVVYARSLKSKEILEDIAVNRVTLMVGVPLLFEKMYHAIRREVNAAPVVTRRLFWAMFAVTRLLRHSRIKAGRLIFRSFRAKAGLTTIRMFVSGGAPLPREVARFFNVVGFEFLQGYGMTECSPVVSVNQPHDNRYGSVGPPLCNVQVRIDHPDEHGIGEICVKAESTTPGYRGNPKATAELLRDGWLYTGDLGRLHKGHLWITGRAKNVIVSAAGKNIYPEEIEERLLASQYVLEAIVVGRRKENEGEIVWAVIVPDIEAFQAEFSLNPADPDRAKLREVLAKEVETVNAISAEYKRIVGFDISLAELEKTSTKKVRRQHYRTSNP